MKNFGIIGAGMIARFHAKAIQAMKSGTLISVYARDAEKAHAFASEFGCKAYSDLDTMLADENLDIVTITTPSGAHLEPCLKAARSGQHVICEKPLEITPDRIFKMIQACHENNVVLSGIFNRRFNPAVVALKEAIRSNRFGKLTLCDAQIKWYRTQAYYDSAEWRGTMALDGGGALMNQSIHTIDLLIYLVGNVKRVSAATSLLIHQDIEVEDTAVAILEFENGALGTIQGSTACWSSTGHPAEIQICGSDGSVFLSDDTFRFWEFKNEKASDEIIRQDLMKKQAGGAGANDPNAIDFLGHQRNFEDVVAAIENNRPPLISGEEAMKSVLLINAIYESAENDGKWVTLLN